MTIPPTLAAIEGSELPQTTRPSAEKTIPLRVVSANDPVGPVALIPARSIVFAIDPLFCKTTEDRDSLSELFKGASSLFLPVDATQESEPAPSAQAFEHDEVFWSGSLASLARASRPMLKWFLL